MKLLAIISLLILLLTMNNPATAQYDTGYYCYQCPVCGTIFKLTAYEVANTNPYTLCPACGQAYAGYFIQVPCQGNTPSSQGYGSTDSNILNGPDQGSYQSRSTETNIQSSNAETSEVSGRERNQQNNQSTKGKILMILAPKDYQERELNIPRDYFRSSGYAVLVASKGVKTATSTGGETTPIDLDLKDVKVSDFSAIVFIGGEGIYDLKLNEDSDYINLAKAASSQKVLIGAICLGPWILADAGLLNGKKATAAEMDHIKTKGAIAVDESVVKDGNIITGNGPEASEEFAKAIVASIEGGSPQSLSKEGATGDNSEVLGSKTAISSTSASSPKYKCTKCSYVYDPTIGDPTQNIPPGTPFEKLPSTWKCPWCGASKSSFVMA